MHGEGAVYSSGDGSDAAARRGVPGATRSYRVRKEPPPAPSGRAWPYGCSDFRLPASGTVRVHVSCLKPPSLQDVVTAALANGQSHESSLPVQMCINIHLPKSYLSLSFQVTVAVRSVVPHL